MTDNLRHACLPDGVAPAPPVEPVTLSNALRRAAALFADKPALNFMGARIRYRDLEGLVNAFCKALSGLGIRPGDKVALCLPNIPQTVIANLAVFRAGAVAVQTNPLYTDRELASQLAGADVRLAITLSAMAQRFDKLKPVTGIKTVVACRFHAWLPPLKRLVFPLAKRKWCPKLKTGNTVFLFKDLIGRYDASAVEDRSQWNAPAALIFTGGTTGTSKAVTVTHANLSSNVQQFAACFPGWRPGGESLVGTYPIFHSAGFNLVQNFPVWQAYEHIMVPRPCAKAVIAILRKDKPTLLPAVPTLLHGLLDDPAFRKLDLSFLKGIFSGAAPLPAAVISDLRQLTDAPLCEVYGLTEASPLVSATAQNGLFKAGSVGLPVPHTKVRIVDMQTGRKELPRGQAGEITVRGPQVMAGYYNNPAETQKVLRDGWLYTGDVGMLDEDGYLTVIDRTKDVIIAGGFNVYPAELDSVLGRHPKIREACAVGVPDAYRGETVKVYIVPRDGQPLSREEVLAYCRRNLAPYKVPRIIEFTGDLPKSTAVGKVLRHELRKLAAGSVNEQARGPESVEPETA